MVLDVGTGRGLFSIWFARYGCRVHALDISGEMIELARKNAESMKVKDRILFFLGDAEDLSIFPRETYDWVSCMSTLDHLPDLNKAIAEMAARLRKGSLFLFNYCPPNSFYGIFFRLYVTYISKFYKLGNEGGLVARLYSHSEIEQTLQRHHIAIERRYGLGIFCFPLRPEYEMGMLTGIPRCINRLEEALLPFYKLKILAKRCQLVLCIGRKD